jgi:large subunit ribosomal protein L21
VVEGAKVLAEIVDQRRGPKIIVFKYKAKVRYRRKTGHRQSLTTVRIKEIQGAEKDGT